MITELSGNLQFKRFLPHPVLTESPKIMCDSKQQHSLVASLEAQFQDNRISVRHQLKKVPTSFNMDIFILKKANRIKTVMPMKPKHNSHRTSGISTPFQELGTQNF